MPRRSEPLPSDTNPECPTLSYTSNILPLFLEGLEDSNGNLLDIGPVSGGNIGYLSGRVGRLYVYDLFRHLDQAYRKGFPASRVWRDLTYPPGLFDAIQLWNIGDYLDDKDFRGLIEACLRMGKPKARMMVVAMGPNMLESQVSCFCIGQVSRLTVRPNTGLDLPVHYRHNRNLIAILNPFSLVRSFIYRSGIREFLFQHP